MFKSIKSIAVSALVISLLSACGGGGGGGPVVDTSGGTPTGPTGPVTPAVVAKASDYTGSWIGYTTLNAVKTPINFTLTGIDNTGAVTGNVYATKLSGPFVGTLDNTGKATGTVANKVDGGTWTVQLSFADSTVSVVSATYGTATLGVGSCTAKPLMAVDMSGSWVGTLVEINTSTGAPIANAVIQYAEIELAYDSQYNQFVGAIVTDKGLVSRIKFNVASGYWFCALDQQSSWGAVTQIPHNTIYTQQPIASTSQLTSAFLAAPAAPAPLMNIILADEYDVAFNGVVYPSGGFKQYKLGMTRP